mgnify:CR=1 FL=1
MNVTILNKLERGWIRMNWKSAIRRNKLSAEQLEALVDKVDNFKSNRSAKEIILYKYKVLPIYVTIYREEYPQLLEYLLSRFVEIEKYEIRGRIVKLQTKLKKYGKILTINDGSMDNSENIAKKYFLNALTYNLSCTKSNRVLI